MVFDPGDGPTPPARPTWCCPPPPSWSTTTWSPGLRRAGDAPLAAGGGAGGRGAAEPRGLRRSVPRGWGSRGRASRRRPRRLDAVAAGPPQRVRGRARRDGFAFPDCGPAPVQFATSSRGTGDGKVHLVPDDLDNARRRAGLYASSRTRRRERFPLALISPGRGAHHQLDASASSTGASPALEIHPQTPRPAASRTGETVRIWNELGEVRVPARAQRGAAARAWYSCPRGCGATTRSRAHRQRPGARQLTDLGGGACFNDARVEVAKL